MGERRGSRNVSLRSVAMAETRFARMATKSFAIYERLRRQRVERIVAEGARQSSNKTRGPVGRIVRDFMLPFVFKFLVTEKSLNWICNHHIDWDSPWFSTLTILPSAVLQKLSDRACYAVYSVIKSQLACSNGALRTRNHCLRGPLGDNGRDIKVDGKRYIYVSDIPVRQIFP